MKILQINKYHYIKGGSDIVFFNTIELLRSNGHEVIPFSIHHSKNMPSKYSNYFVHSPEIRGSSLGSKLRSIPRFIVNQDAVRKVEKLIEAEKPEIAHIHNLFNGISLSILPVLKKHNIPIVISMHDTRFICPSSYFTLRGKLCENCVKSYFSNCAINKCYEDNLANSIMLTFEMFHKEFLFDYNSYIAKYIFLSHQFLKLHSLRHSYFVEKGTVLYNFFPSDKKIMANNKKGLYMFYYGRITVEKGIGTLIKAIKSFPNIKLKVAGTGPMLNELIQEASPNVEFLGFLTGSKLNEAIQNASFVLVPSECQDNNPLTIIEAYSLGKPVLGAKIGGIPEIVEEGKTGFIFESNNVKSLERVISKSQGISPKEYGLMSQNSREFAKKNFSPHKHYSELMKIYNEAIQDKI